VVKKNQGRASPLDFIKPRRLKYTWERTTLNTVVSNLEDWQRRYDPSWFLIMRIADPVIDQQLAAQEAEQAQSAAPAQGPASSVNQGRDERQSPLGLAASLRDALRPDPRRHISVFLPPLEVQKIDIPFSNAKIAQRGRQWYIIDRYSCQSGRSLSAQNNDVRTLAQKLSSVDPWTFALLKCKGVIKVMDDYRQQIRSFDFVFYVPDSNDQDLQSLRQNLLMDEMIHSVSKRVLIAKELAKSVNYVHNLKFVHKHICPETILLFHNDSRFSTFLVGFDNFRAADGGTIMAGDSAWERNLYRHPSRQGDFPEEAYMMQHDAYSLGVCLLEIGLWQSFVAYSSNVKPVPQRGEAYRQFSEWLEDMGTIQKAKNPRSPEYQTMIALKLKEYFVHLAQTKLPISMGDQYSAVVMTCLTCLDEGNEGFGDDDYISDEEGIQMAVRFIDKILTRLDGINV